MMTEEIYAVAAAMAAPSGEEKALLERFCQVEEQALLRRAPELPEICRETFLCAAGSLAAADLLDSRQGDAERFTVGDVSVQRGAGGGDGGRLRQQAERMLAAWGAPGGFAFLEVRG